MKNTKMSSFLPGWAIPDVRYYDPADSKTKTTVHGSRINEKPDYDVPTMAQLDREADDLRRRVGRPKQRTAGRVRQRNGAMTLPEMRTARDSAWDAGNKFLARLLDQSIRGRRGGREKATRQ